MVNAGGERGQPANENAQAGGGGNDAPVTDRRRGTGGLHASDAPSAAAPARREVDRPDGHADASHPVQADKVIHLRLPELTDDELARLGVLEAGTQLEQGGTYVDLNDEAHVPLEAIGGQRAGAGDRLVAKRDTDCELWNRIVGQQTEPELERPTSASA
jgi:hypothetical protein